VPQREEAQAAFNRADANGNGPRTAAGEPAILKKRWHPSERAQYQLWSYIWIFEHARWRWALNDGPRTAAGEPAISHLKVLYQHFLKSILKVLI
jgi:hypothetical protein